MYSMLRIIKEPYSMFLIIMETIEYVKNSHYLRQTLIIYREGMYNILTVKTKITTA